jgi:hypothetical protein
MIATIFLRSYPICLCRYEIRFRSRTTTPRSSARYILSSPSLTGANSGIDTRWISHESLGRRHQNGTQPVSLIYVSVYEANKKAYGHDTWPLFIPIPRSAGQTHSHRYRRCYDTNSRYWRLDAVSGIHVQGDLVLVWPD